MSAIRSLSGAKRTLSKPHPRCSIYEYTPWFRVWLRPPVLRATFTSPVEDVSSEPVQGGDNQEHFGGQLQRIDEESSPCANKHRFRVKSS